MTTSACVDSGTFGLVTLPALEFVSRTVGIQKCEIVPVSTNGANEQSSAQVLFPSNFFEMVRIDAEFEKTRVIEFEIFRENYLTDDLKDHAVRASTPVVAVPTRTNASEPTPAAIFLNLNVLAPVDGILRRIFASLCASIVSFAHASAKTPRYAIIRSSVKAWHCFMLPLNAPGLELR